MKTINAIGINLAKNVFQICAVDKKRRVVFNRQVKREAAVSTLRDIKPTTVAMEMPVRVKAHELRLMKK